MCCARRTAVGTYSSARLRLPKRRRIVAIIGWALHVYLELFDFSQALDCFLCISTTVTTAATSDTIDPMVTCIDWPAEECESNQVKQSIAIDRTDNTVVITIATINSPRGANSHEM